MLPANKIGFFFITYVLAYLLIKLFVLDLIEASCCRGTLILLHICIVLAVVE